MEIHISVTPDQQGDDGVVAFARGQHQRGATVLIDDVDLGARIQQHLRAGQVAEFARMAEGVSPSSSAASIFAPSESR